MKNMAIFAKIKQFFVKLYSSNKKLFVLLVAMVLVVVLAIPSLFLGTKNSDKTKTKTESLSVDNYAQSVENKLENMIILLDAVKEVDVFVMVDSSPKKYFLTETEISKTTNGESVSETKKETIVFEKDGSESHPIEQYISMPKITGVLVFLNKIDSSTKVSVISAISVVLNIDQSCISILQDR